jgi:PPIC-type PPIASE domain
LNLRRVLREPLLHFLLIGLALFLYYGHVAPGNRDARRIVVGQAEVDDLVRQYQATWNRPPTPQELTGLVEAYVHDEILYREGQALGLDRDDAVIKRRVRQKMDVMSEEEIAHEAPTDADLSAYLQSRPDAFRLPAIVSFEQILVGTTEPSGELERKIVAARRALEGGATPATFGQPTMLPARVNEAGLDDVAREFGEPFARQLLTAPLGHWSGPITSGFGAHLVRVSALKPAELPPLQVVRTAVAREWENDQRRRALDGNYRKLRLRYDVVIEAKLLEGTRR